MLISPISSSGRPASLVRAEAFYKTSIFLEEINEKAFTISELCEKMEEFSEPKEEEEEDFFSYCNKYMKHKLGEYFGDDIIFSDSPGCNIEGYS